MPNNTLIEWTDLSSNPIYAVRVDTGQRGHYCTKISPLCLNCYADGINLRFGTHLSYLLGNEDLIEFKLDRDELERLGRKTTNKKVFMFSQTDFFHRKMPIEIQNELYAFMLLNENLTFQILTKRLDQALDFFHQENIYQNLKEPMEYWCNRLKQKFPNQMRPLIVRPQLSPAKHIWIGFSAGTQREVDNLLPKLAEVPAYIRFLSGEPLLEGINISESTRFLNWVIAGGESGLRARPSDPEWFRSLRDQCQNAGIPFFFKQHGSYAAKSQLTLEQRANIPETKYKNPIILGGDQLYKIGKKSAGRLLDGQLWNQFPEANNC